MVNWDSLWSIVIVCSHLLVVCGGLCWLPGCLWSFVVVYRWFVVVCDCLLVGCGCLLVVFDHLWSFPDGLWSFLALCGRVWWFVVTACFSNYKYIYGQSFTIMKRYNP